MSLAGFFERAVGPATPGAVGAIRAWTCGILLVMVLAADLSSTTLLPPETYRPQGFMGWLDRLPVGFDAFLADADALRAFRTVTALFLVLGAVGLGTRAAVPAAAVGCFVIGGILRGYSWFWHTGLVPVLVLAVLSCARCGAGFSLDRRLRIARGKPVAPADRPTAEFGWARYAVWTVITAPYVAAGLSKLYWNGPGWAAADHLHSLLLRSTLQMMDFDFGLTLRMQDAPDAVFLAGGVATLAAETGCALVLVSRRARLAIPAATAAMHVATLFLMNILFLDLILLSAVFYDWRPARRAVTRRWTGRGDATPAVPPLPRRPSGPAADALRPPVAPASTLPDHGGPSGPAADALRRTHRRGAAAVLAIAAVFAASWAGKIEYYPLTAMQMFTVHATPPYQSGEVTWVRAVVRYEDGSSERAPFGRWIPALERGALYRGAIHGAFDVPAGLQRARTFLNAAVRAAFLQGARPLPESVEVRLRHWDFTRDPHDADRGTLLDRYVHTAWLPPAVERLRAGGAPLVAAEFDVHLRDGQLIYVRTGCSAEDAEARFFLHVVPVDAGDLPEPRRRAGFESLDFDFARYGVRGGGRCIAARVLPPYEVAGIRTGRLAADGVLWQGEARLGE